MPKDDTDLSGGFWNQTEDDAVDEYDDLVDLLVKDLLASGYAPFTEPADEREQLSSLQALRLARSSLYYDNPRAIATLARLERKFA